MQATVQELEGVARLWCHEHVAGHPSSDEKASKGFAEQDSGGGSAQGYVAVDAVAKDHRRWQTLYCG